MINLSFAFNINLTQISQNIHEMSLISIDAVDATIFLGPEHVEGFALLEQDLVRDGHLTAQNPITWGHKILH
jgi:hypothetical protein